MSTWMRGNGFLRTVTGAILLAVVFTLVWVDSLKVGFTLFVALLAIVALYEFQAMAQGGASRIEQTGGAAFVLMLIVAAHYGGLEVLNLCLLLVLLAAATLHLFAGARTINGLATVVFALLYCGWLPAHFVLLRNFEERGIQGHGLVMFLILVIAVSDTAAYVVGKNFGRHKLAPTVSPKKTWEGALGAVVGAAAVGIAAGAFIVETSHGPKTFGILASDSVRVSVFSPYWLALPAVLLSIVGQIGDLVESMLKRDGNVKDSGGFLPGHGGVLDRCDGFLFAGPLLYHMVVCVPIFRMPIICYF